MIIKIQARQTGKSYDIAQAMKKEKSSVAIFPYMIMKTQFCAIYKISEKRVFAISEIKNNPELARGFKKVYMDEIGICMSSIIPNIKYATHTDY